MQLEQDIQKRFVETITHDNSLALPSKAHTIYKDLLYYRFEEVFENAYPRFRKRVSDAVFKECIYSFLALGAKNPIIWKVSEEFKEHLINENTLDIPHLQDLLEFEFLELEMFMQNYEACDVGDFSLQNKYEFSQFSQLRTFEYPIHHPEFDSRSESFEKGKYSVLFYYDDTTDEVMYEEISPFVHELLNMIEGTKPLMYFLEKISKMYEVDVVEVVELLEEPLTLYVQNKILREVK